MLNTPLLPSLSGPLWLGVIAPDKVLSMSQIELRTYAKLNCLNYIYIYIYIYGFGIK